MEQEIRSPGATAGVPALSVADLRALIDDLAAMPTAHTDAECFDQLNALERIKSAAAAAQAAVTCEFAESRTARAEASAAAKGLPAHKVRPDAGIGAQVALARQESPHSGRAHLDLSRALLSDMPHTYAALARGDISEHRAQIIAGETSALTREQRLAVDAELAPDMAGLGDVRLRHAVRRIVMRLDEDGVLRRRAAARARRRVTCRRLGDGMSQVAGVVADTDAGAIMATLAQFADQRSVLSDKLGEDRTRGQVISDTFVERLTGRVGSQSAPVALKVVVSAETLLGVDTTPGEVLGVGPVPASICRRLVRNALDRTGATIQRLFRMPETGALVAMERADRTFPADLREFLEIRDQVCRTPYCNAPIRVADHVTPWRLTNQTTTHDGQGLCEACNYVKEEPGWRHRTVSEELEPHAVEITTPTGHSYRSREPGMPRPSPETGSSSPELYFSDLVLAV